MAYRFTCEFCGTATDDADFSGPGCVCDGCGLVYQVGPTAESLKMVLAREIRRAKAKPPSACQPAANGKDAAHASS